MEDAVFMTLYYFLSSRIFILKHCDKAWHLWDRPLAEPFIKPHRYLSGQGGGGGSKRKTRPHGAYNAQDGMILWDWDQKGRSKSMNPQCGGFSPEDNGYSIA